jgi:hypothetical protein
MKRLEVSGAVRPLYGSLGDKRLSVSGTVHQWYRCWNVINVDKLAFAFQAYIIQPVTDRCLKLAGN